MRKLPICSADSAPPAFLIVCAVLATAIGCSRTTTATQPAPPTSTASTAAAPNDLMDRELQSLRVRRQAAEYAFAQSLQTAGAAAARGDFPAARAALLSAEIAIADAGLFSPQRLAELQLQLVQARLDVELAARTADEHQRAAERRRAAEHARLRAEGDAEQQRRTVQQLTRTANDLIYQGQYAHALGVLDQVLSIDPANSYARGAGPLVRDAATLRTQRDLRERRDREFEKQLNAAAEKQIPYDGVVNYPANWPEISYRRESRQGP